MSKVEKIDFTRTRRTVFGTLEPIEATEPLRLHPVQRDVDTAVRGDPCKCVFANTAKRMYGATAVLFWQRFAYVDFIDEDGERRVHRYWIKANMVKKIRDFDMGKKFTLGHAFVLSVVPLSNRRAYHRSYDDAYRTSPRGIAIIAESNAKRGVEAAMRRVEVATANLKEVRATEKPRSDKIEVAIRELQTKRAALNEAKVKHRGAVAASDHARKVHPAPKGHGHPRLVKPQVRDPRVHNIRDGRGGTYRLAA